MKLKTLLLILAFVAAGGFLIRDFYEDRANGRSLEEIQAKEQLSKATYAKVLRDRKLFEVAKNSEIAELQGHLDSNAVYIERLQADKSKADRELSKIRESWQGLDLVCQGKLKELDEAWTHSFSLAQEEISVLKEDKRLLNLQITAKDEIIASLHVALSAAEDRISSLEDISKTLAGKYIRARNIGYLKTVGIVAIAVLAVIL